MEGAIPEFLFEEDQFVLIGEGDCARLALRDAIEADAVPVILKTREMWLEDPENGPLPESAIYDAGNVPQNRAVLECLQRNLNRPKIFLAGEIPLGTAFRAPPLYEFDLAFLGEHPRRIERRALERYMKAYDFQPWSLHDVHCGDVETSLLVDPAKEVELRTGLEDALSRCRAAVASGFRPSFDMIRESTETALITERQDDVVFAVSWLLGAFDTAYFNRSLADRYCAAEARMIVFDDRAMLLEGAALMAHCDMVGLDLYTIQPRVQ